MARVAEAVSYGAVTIVNAMATGKGAALGTKLWTRESNVDISGRIDLGKEPYLPYSEWSVSRGNGEASLPSVWLHQTSGSHSRNPIKHTDRRGPEEQ